MKKPRVALLVNQVAPNRVALYERLTDSFDLRILHAGMEANRTSWREADVTGAEMRKVKGWQFSIPRRQAGEVFDRWFLHIEPEYFTDLIKTRPDAVISFEMGFRTLAAILYGELFRKPVWIWWGGTHHTERAVGPLRLWVRRAIAAHAKHWISYGQTSTEYLENIGVRRNRILQIQNSVDETWFRGKVASRFELNPKPVLLHVGQMIARKGVDRLIRVSAALQREGAVFSLVLVGSGPDELRIRKLVQEMNLRNVHFYPAQPASAIPEFYRAADALIFPTLEDVWGLVANEAVLSGLPVLCSKYAGCAPELFSSDCIFDPADHEDFLDGLRRTVGGRLPKPDKTRLKSTGEVASAIQRAVLASLPVDTATPFGPRLAHPAELALENEEISCGSSRRI